MICPGNLTRYAVLVCERTIIQEKQNWVFWKLNLSIDYSLIAQLRTPKLTTLSMAISMPANVQPSSLVQNFSQGPRSPQCGSNLLLLLQEAL
mmetsp:Transcript_55627/g.92463  ORF Transcript_55627/g.92463 Transcript_55627/m.92463 type:complete len:92 (+) Transcript_55627:94-369(+)